MNRPQSANHRHCDLLAAANRVLTLPEAGAIATEMALRSASIGRWSLRSQCVLQLQEQATGIRIDELGTRDEWGRRGRKPRNDAVGFYVFSPKRGDRTSFKVWSRSQTRAVRHAEHERPEWHNPSRTWLRTLRYDLEHCGFELQRTEGPATRLDIDGRTVLFAAKRHRDAEALALLAQCCAGILLTDGRRSRSCALTGENTSTTKRGHEPGAVVSE